MKPLLSKEQWLEHYLYTEIHGILFASFPSEFYEWIKKLVYCQGRCRLHKLIAWTPELVRRLEASEENITHTIDHWLD